MPENNFILRCKKTHRSPEFSAPKRLGTRQYHSMCCDDRCPPIRNGCGVDSIRVRLATPARLCGNAQQSWNAPWRSGIRRSCASTNRCEEWAESQATSWNPAPTSTSSGCSIARRSTHRSSPSCAALNELNESGSHANIGKMSVISLLYNLTCFCRQQSVQKYWTSSQYWKYGKCVITLNSVYDTVVCVPMYSSSDVIRPFSNDIRLPFQRLPSVP